MAWSNKDGMTVGLAIAITSRDKESTWDKLSREWEESQEKRKGRNFGDNMRG